MMVIPQEDMGAVERMLMIVKMEVRKMMDGEGGLLRLLIEEVRHHRLREN